MTTKFVGIKEFRENFTSLWKSAKKKNIRYIILYHSTPVLEVKPLSPKEKNLEEIAVAIAEAREQVKGGDVYTEEAVQRKLGIL